MTMNEPYKKIYKNGILINPIKGFRAGRKYLYTDKDGVSHFAPNRRQRRLKSTSANNRPMSMARRNRQFVKIAKKGFKVLVHDIRFVLTKLKRKKS